MKNSNAVKDKYKDFSEDLENINMDWPLLGEISGKKSKLEIKLKNKPKNSLNISKITKNISKDLMQEDKDVSDPSELDEKLFEESFIIKPVSSIQSNAANDVPEEMVQNSTASIEVKKVYEKPDIIGTNPLLRLIAIGLAKLYVKKTTTVLNPVKFVAENYKDVLIAIIHLGVPAAITWFLLTQVSFITEQLIGVTEPMFTLYSVVFYFAALFTWVTGQVLVAGLIAMIKTTLISVAKNAQQDID